VSIPITDPDQIERCNFSEILTAHTRESCEGHLRAKSNAPIVAPLIETFEETEIFE
jgi:hypothetical protein